MNNQLEKMHAEKCARICRQLKTQLKFQLFKTAMLELPYNQRKHGGVLSDAQKINSLGDLVDWLAFSDRRFLADGDNFVFVDNEGNIGITTAVRAPDGCYSIALWLNRPKARETGNDD